MPLDLSTYRDKIQVILETLVEKGRGIEVNTSGLRSGQGCFPDLEVVRLFKELGGEAITVGSDAHFKEDVGQGIAQGYELIKAAGFKYVATFSDRRPEFIKI